MDEFLGCSHEDKFRKFIKVGTGLFNDDISMSLPELSAELEKVIYYTEQRKTIPSHVNT